MFWLASLNVVFCLVKKMVLGSYKSIAPCVRGGDQLSNIAMLRIASYQRQKYWRQIRRNARYVSLNTLIEDGDGDSVELVETLADDRAINLEQ